MEDLIHLKTDQISTEHDEQRGIVTTMDSSKLQTPHLVQFDRIGSTSLGYLSVAERDNLPFPVKRVYWTYFTPESVTRGGHAHRRLNQILVAVAGRIIINTEMRDGTRATFVLEDPDKGLFLPVNCWRTMKYTHNSVQMVLCSMEYTEEDYIRDYEVFKAGDCQ